jgi:hypothetical protein
VVSQGCSNGIQMNRSYDFESASEYHLRTQGRENHINIIIIIIMIIISIITITIT